MKGYRVTLNEKRKIIYLHEIVGLSVMEIAKVTGYHTKTVNRHIREHCDQTSRIKSMSAQWIKEWDEERFRLNPNAKRSGDKIER